MKIKSLDNLNYGSFIGIGRIEFKFWTYSDNLSKDSILQCHEMQICITGEPPKLKKFNGRKAYVYNASLWTEEPNLFLPEEYLINQEWELIINNAKNKHINQGLVVHDITRSIDYSLDIERPKYFVFSDPYLDKEETKEEAKKIDKLQKWEEWEFVPNPKI